MFTFYFFQQLLWHTQLSTFPSWNHSTKIKDVKIESKHDFIEHKLMSEIECILGVKQTKQVDKQYLVNGNGATQRDPMGKTKSYRSFTRNSGQVWVGKGQHEIEGKTQRNKHLGLKCCR